MSIAAYEAEFHVLYRYTPQLLITEERSICIFINSLNYDLEVLFVHMTSTEKGFNKVSDNVKKLEGVTQAGPTKILAMKS